jgi:hypothetical protein
MQATRDPTQTRESLVVVILQAKLQRPAAHSLHTQGAHLSVRVWATRRPSEHDDALDPPGIFNPLLINPAVPLGWE